MAMAGRLDVVVATGESGLLSGLHDGGRLIGNCTPSTSLVEYLSLTLTVVSEFSPATAWTLLSKTG